MFGAATAAYQVEGAWNQDGKAFINYAKTCFEVFGDKVKNFIRFNETIVFCAWGYLVGADPPGVKNDPKKYFQATHNVFCAHAESIIEYKKLNQFGEIGMSNVFSPSFPATDSKEDVISLVQKYNRN